MNDSDIDSHRDSVRRRVQDLPSRDALAFGLWCIERMLPIYERASIGRHWANWAVLRSAVDDGWSSLAGGAPVPLGTSDRSRVAIPDAVDIVDSESAAALLIGNSIADFLAEAEGERPEYAHFMADRIIDLIEMLEDEELSAHSVVDSLVTAEIARQDELLRRLQVDEGTQDWGSVREGARRTSPFGPEWFVSL